MKWLFLLLLSCCLKAQAQGFRSRIYLPGASDPLTRAVFPTATGYFGAGFCTNDLDNAGQVCILGLDKEGVLLWSKKYGSAAFSYYQNQLVTQSFYKSGDHIYYAGAVDDGSPRVVGVLIKFNLKGDTIWQKVFRDPDPQQDLIPQMVTASVDGGFLITGFFQHWINNTRQGLLIKTDSNGNELWRKEISKTSPDVEDGKAIIQDTASKKIVIVGYQYPFSNALYQNLVVLDSIGNFESRNNYATGNPLDMIQANDKTFYFTGYRTEEDQGNTTWYYPFIARFSLADPSYAIWYKEYGPKSLSAGFSSIKEVPQGVMVSGWYDTTALRTGYGNLLVRFLTVSSTGKKITDRLYDYKSNSVEEVNNIAPLYFESTDDNGWIVAVSVQNITGPNPFFFIKYDSNGCDSTLSYCTIASAMDANQFEKLEVFPVPCDEELVISNNLADLTACLFDSKGSLILHMKLDSSQEKVHIPTANFSDGLYLLQLEGGGTHLEKKVIITH
jgi:hypothetical protein